MSRRPLRPPGKHGSRPLRRRLPRGARRGQSLVEFAAVALVFYLLLAAILTFGHALYVAQGLQTAADLGAREIARTPLPADITLDNPADATEPGALHNDDVRCRIFDEAFLVIDLNAFYGSDPDADFFQNAVADMPLLNQQLAPLMIVDQPDFNGDGVRDAWLLRYPGALLTRSTPIEPPKDLQDPERREYPDWVAREYAVGIPVVTSRAGDGAETIRWVPVVQEIESDAAPNPFRVTSMHRGIVALRVNYPFQAAAMSSFRPNPAGPFEPTIGAPNAADDGGVIELNPKDRPGGLTGATLQSGDVYTGTYGGQYGLGAQGALGSQTLTGGRPVRPYRRVISAQAIYRREIFANESSEPSESP